MPEKMRLLAKGKKEESVSPKSINNVSPSFNSPGDQNQYLQRTIGNQAAMHRFFQSDTFQAKLKVSQPNDTYEQEADKVADQVMRMPKTESPECAEKSYHISRKIAYVNEQTDESVPDDFIQNLDQGQPLDSDTRLFFEPRFGNDLNHVRIHTDVRAGQSARDLNAQAYTVGSDIVFGTGQYQPGIPEGQRLIAHELTHVVQQTGQKNRESFIPQNVNFGQDPGIQRKIELRPPGKGEASAFGRAKELVDRLNTVSPAIQYELKGQDLSYTVKDVTKLTHFDTVMKGFIDLAQIVPMRLIVSKGYVGGGPLFADSFSEAYVDLDDLLADDIYSFQSDLLHFLTERFQVKDYERLIGTNLDPQFPAAHRAGKNAEAAQLQYLFNDPSVAFVYEESKPNDTWVNAFKSKDHGYWVFQVVRKHSREVAGGEMWVKKKDGTRISIDDFRKERAAAP